MFARAPLLPPTVPRTYLDVCGLCTATAASQACRPASVPFTQPPLHHNTRNLPHHNRYRLSPAPPPTAPLPLNQLRTRRLSDNQHSLRLFIHKYLLPSFFFVFFFVIVGLAVLTLVTVSRQLVACDRKSQSSEQNTLTCHPSVYTVQCSLVKLNEEWTRLGHSSAV